jgi:hypothetical protein
LESVEQSVPSVYVPPIQVSTFYLMLGQTDRALAWLEEAFVQRDSQLLWLGSDPVFEPLRANPGSKASWSGSPPLSNRARPPQVFTVNIVVFTAILFSARR